MSTLNSVVRRGSLLATAFALVVSAVIPAVNVSADALNPLTERSLLLSSSAPGFQDTDGSGNSEGNPNASGTNYAPPGSGPNGKKSGETFTFKVSTDSAAAGEPIEAFTFQYCTLAAGFCRGPGDNLGDARVGATTARESNATANPLGRSDLDVNFGADDSPAAGTDFDIFVDSDADGIADQSVSTGWEMKTSVVEDDDYDGDLTGKKNFITLYNTSSTLAPTPQTQIRIVFKASSTRYITNPGSGSFFVKINSYKDGSAGAQLPATDANIIDGGVTVANVMTDSIHITTKVLETMSFSVGTRNRDTKVIGCAFVDQATTPDCEGATADHGPCDVIQKPNNNRLNLGNPSAEYSLETGRAWDVNSYWRLSSNSSGGATVYYSGDTLKNTVGDDIDPMLVTALSNPGQEQFGLAVVNPTTNDVFDPEFTTLVNASGTDKFRDPGLYTLTPVTDYNQGEGAIGDGTATPIAASFKFNPLSSTVPEVIASDNDDVITCATAKMRYVANIGADTPAGVYTTKINYLAAPQY
jgi:hypothetical protein